MSLNKITIYGNASKKTIKTLTVEERDQQKYLLQFLRNHGIPVANACGGEGVCQKCVANKDLLTCQITVLKFLEQNKQGLLIFDYL